MVKNLAIAALIVCVWAGIWKDKQSKVKYEELQRSNFDYIIGSTKTILEQDYIIKKLLEQRAARTTHFRTTTL